ncbi:LysR family transcriptional regulator [Pseudonocardia sp. NPDC049635]|uniref:LysR family transcriptional regulator n=1 Tax=Pseudonocardia sp. NPDC049635 TaxID=3155506 RepID=UPI0033DDDD4D
MQVELRHLRAFVAVARELNFTRAAERMHLAQQALSTQIQRLEKSLGTDLFVRTTRRVELTAAGELLLAEVAPLLESLDAAFERTRRAGQEGGLSIAYTPTVAPEALPAGANRMHREYPTITLRTAEMWQPESVEGVRSGRLDVCFIRTRAGTGDLATAVVRQEPLGIVLGDGHPLGRRPVVRIDRLGDTYLTIWPRAMSPGYFDAVCEAFRAAGYTGPVREYENHTRDTWFGDTVARMEIASGRAFSVGFRSQPLTDGFVWRELDPAPSVPLTVCWREPANTTLRLFLDVVHAVAREERWLTDTP